MILHFSSSSGAVYFYFICSLRLRMNNLNSIDFTYHYKKCFTIKKDKYTFMVIDMNKNFITAMINFSLASVVNSLPSVDQIDKQI